MSLEGHCTGLSKIFKIHSVGSERWDKNLVLGRFVVEGLTFMLSIPRSI